MGVNSNDDISIKITREAYDLLAESRDKTGIPMKRIVSDIIKNAKAEGAI